jgi:hypothetical protein
MRERARPDEPVVMLGMAVRCGLPGWHLNGTPACFMWSSEHKIGNLWWLTVTPGGAWRGYG